MMKEDNEFTRRNIEEFRSNHGRLGGPFEGAPVLLLHTTGARRGQERMHPLMYLADDGRYLLFASAAGVDRSPAWYQNLKANPTPASNSLTTSPPYKLLSPPAQ